VVAKRQGGAGRRGLKPAYRRQGLVRFKRRVRFKKLRQHGVGANLTAQTAGSNHGPWRVADSPAMHSAFPLACFDSLAPTRLSAGP